MGRYDEVQARLGDFQTRLKDVSSVVDEGWPGWKCLLSGIDGLEKCLADLPQEAFDFTVPNRIRVRGAKTIVGVSNIQTPPGWKGTTTWSWSIDGALLHEGPESQVELDTSGLWPGDHTLSVTAVFDPYPAEAKGSLPVDRIVGADPDQIRRLLDAGHRTTGDLLREGARPAGRAAIARETGIDGASLLRLVHQSDLIRVTGVAGQYAALLEAAGVETVKKLAQRNPANLLQRFEAMPQVVDRLPTLDEVVAWVNESKDLPPAVFNEDDK